MKHHYSYSIIRNGQEIILTDDEIFGAYRTFQRKSDEEQISYILNERGLSVTNEVFDQIVSDYERFVSKGFDEEYAIDRTVSLLHTGQNKQ